MSSKIQDCYYYYYSTCSKGDTCSFRHEPSAMKNETMCVHWLKGKCIRPHCNFRHMELKKNRSKIPCFHESQPGGCQKDHCPFLHTNTTDPNNEDSTSVNSSKNVINKENGCKSDKSLLQDCKQIAKQRSKERTPSGRKAWPQPQGIDKTNPLAGSRDPSATLLKTISITPFELAKCLSEFSGFTTTLLVLLEKFQYTPIQVKTIVIDNCNTFKLEGKSVSLRPKIELCPNYLGAGGCDSVSLCQALHICKGFVMGQCQEENCLYGHSFTTNHNKIVINNFKLSLLSPNLIFTLFFRFVFVDSDFRSKLEVCRDYGEGKCHNKYCVKLHLCFPSLANCCTEEKCTLNHDIFNPQVSSVLSQSGIDINESRRDVLMNITASPLIKQSVGKLTTSDQSTLVPKSSGSSQDSMKTIWSDDLNGEVAVNEICYKSVVSLCPFEDTGCQRLHSDFHFYWQVKSTSGNNKFWVNLIKYQVMALEKAYCNPHTETTHLLPLDTTALKSSSRELLFILNGKSKWEVNFTTMQLTLPGQKQSLSLRRLCTPHTANSFPEPSVFLWYFLDQYGRWIEYGKTDSSGKSKLKVNIDSIGIEKNFRQSPTLPLSFKSDSYSYSLDFVKMRQTNLATNVTREVRRRPMPHIQEAIPTATAGLPSHWEIMQPNERVRKVNLSTSSEEFQKLVAFITQQNGKLRQIYKIYKIERIQNPYFWRAFQNKVEEMTTLYGSGGANIQQLFHGTNPLIVPKIYDENFDWRLHGSNVGQAFGRGTYFSPYISTSYHYTTPDASGYRYIFVAKVAVGSVTVGNSSMTRPPINPQTNLPFDSTVDTTQKPSKIVKYDKQEYFPEYILTLT